MRISVRVPATAANLGPGFDCLGLALDLCNDVTIDTAERPAVRWEGEGADELPTDGSDMISRAMSWVADAVGRRLPPLALSARNRIPLERGLGSSASACVAGIVAAHRLLGLELEPDGALGMAEAIEGHPDNAAAAIHGGLTIAYRADDGACGAIRLEPHAGLRPVVLVPEHLRLSTSRARDALPAMVSLGDASFNVGRAALAVVALADRPHLLAEALEDRLHQAVRLRAVPEAAAVLERTRAAGVPACVSGAGPGLLAFEAAGRTVPDPGPGWRLIHVAPRGIGAEVTDA
jgi:homoserine kinase